MSPAAARVLISEWMDEAGCRLLARRCIAVAYRPDLHRQRDLLTKELASADGLIVRNATRVDAGLIAGASRLKVVGRLGAGLDNIDTASLRQAGIITTYAPTSTTISVAEYTLGALCALARRLPQFHRELMAGEWERRVAGFQLYGRRLGILGLGRIGLAVARRAQAFGLEVQSWHPRRRPRDLAVREAGVTLVSYERLLSTSHILSLHLPLTAETRGLLDTGAFATMGRGIFIINAGRGELIDEQALVQALASGKVGGAVLDVRRSEPPGPHDPLRPFADRLLLTPHVAALTPEAQRETALTVAEDVARCLGGQQPRYRVPPPA